MEKNEKGNLQNKNKGQQLIFKKLKNERTK